MSIPSSSPSVQSRWMVSGAVAAAALVGELLFGNGHGHGNAAPAPAPAAEPHAHRIGARVAGEIAAEFRAVRPADIEGNSPQIPPSETWPAQ